MSESGEGSPASENIKVTPLAESLFDEYGQIKSTSVEVPEVSANQLVIDTDDLPENQGMTPAVNLARLRSQLNNAPEVDANSLIAHSSDKDSSK